MKKRLIGMAMAAVLGYDGADRLRAPQRIHPLSDSLTFTYVTSPLNLPSIVEKEGRRFSQKPLRMTASR